MSSATDRDANEATTEDGQELRKPDLLAIREAAMAHMACAPPKIGAKIITTKNVNMRLFAVVELPNKGDPTVKIIAAKRIPLKAATMILAINFKTMTI